MFSRWGAFIYRHRLPVAILAIALAIASATLATRTADALSAGGWLDADNMLPMFLTPATPVAIAAPAGFPLL